MIIGRLPAWRLVDLCTKPTISMEEDPQLEPNHYMSRMVKDHKCPPIVNRRMSHNILQYDLVFSLSEFLRDFSQSSQVFSVFSWKYRNIHEYPKKSQRKIMKRSQHRSVFDSRCSSHQHSFGGLPGH